MENAQNQNTGETIGHPVRGNASDTSVTEIESRFGAYRKPTEKTIPKFKALQQKALEFAHLIDELCPHSKQKGTALTLLEECKMSANAAVAIHEGEVVQ